MRRPRYVRDVACPECEVRAGQPCRASDRTKRRHHEFTFHHVRRTKKFQRERPRAFGDTEGLRKA
jgi:hypothetical protein